MPDECGAWDPVFEVNCVSRQGHMGDKHLYEDRENGISFLWIDQHATPSVWAAMMEGYIEWGSYYNAQFPLQEED